MGCNNSHLRPIFRRCRRRSKKDEPSNNITPPPKGDIIERNGSQDHLQVQLLGASLRNNTTSTTGGGGAFLTTIKSTTENNQPSTTDSSSAFCVPLLQQSEASTSQIDFFRMLDQKIEEGPDYTSEEEIDHHHRSSLPTLRLGTESERGGPSVTGKSLITSQILPLRDPLRFTNWSYDEDGD